MKKSILLLSLLCMSMLPPIADAAEGVSPKETQSTALNEAEQLLIDSIKGIKSGVSQTIDFAKEQIPDVVQQLVVYNLAWNLTLLTIGILIAIVLFVASIRFWKGSKSDRNADMPFVGFIIAMSNLFGAIVWVSLIVSSLDDVLKLWLAPKVWLLEYAAHLLKGH